MIDSNSFEGRIQLAVLSALAGELGVEVPDTSSLEEVTIAVCDKLDPVQVFTLASKLTDFTSFLKGEILK
jgi:hypothetical protein